MIFSAIFILGKAGAESMPAQEDHSTHLTVERLWEMKRIGSPTVSPDENHWILKPNNSLYWYNEVKEWMTEFAALGDK